MGGLLIRLCKGGEGVSFIINTFSSNLNTVKLHLKIDSGPFYKIMKGPIHLKN